jgi:hypothetical protein
MNGQGGVRLLRHVVATYVSGWLQWLFKYWIRIAGRDDDHSVHYTDRRCVPAVKPSMNCLQSKLHPCFHVYSLRHDAVSPAWINWIIVKASVTAPLNLMLQVGTYLFSWSQLKCCARVLRGGGPGGQLPYRVYVDSGVVLLCLFALAPAAPLVAPAAFSYFLLATPMLRRNVIFVYRPRYSLA